MNTPIKLVVGLGNPGSEYENTRHNAGFWWVDALARSAGAHFSRESKFHGEVARVKTVSGDVWLLKPLTYMNRSGQAVSALANFYRITPAEILVAHDEMDLPPGGVKLKMGGSAGSNGIKDIVSHLGTRDFWRLRIGVGHPRDLTSLTSSDRAEVVDSVLKRPSAADQQAIEDALHRTLTQWPTIAQGDIETAMQHLHSKPLIGKRENP
ncbi:MAG: aminoacyl-tRNA hydrolase [Betaproteobacteria bacterium]|nr:aminoacyl-tRNA hydrolase [Betaproteobacteria bacterium]